MEFITTPAASDSAFRRSARMALTSDGALSGEVTVELSGQDALDSRLDAIWTDEAGRQKQFEDLLKAWLPGEAVVKLVESHGWEETDTPLVGRFTVSIPGYAAVTSKRMVFPALPMRTLRKGMFREESRRYPIVFSYPFSENDEVSIRLPEGYSLEAPPYRRKSTLPYGGYETSSAVQDNQLTTKRLLRMDGVSLPPEKYFELRSFFNVVVAGDEGQAVLQAVQKTPAAQP